MILHLIGILAKFTLHDLTMKGNDNRQGGETQWQTTIAATNY